MTVIVISGVEKAGKTTLCKELVWQVEQAGLQADYQHFSGHQPFTGIHGHLLKAHDHNQLVSIIDRSWACAAVYQSLGFEQKKWAIGAHDYGRSAERAIGNYVRATGATIILLGPDAGYLQSLRTEDDLPVSAQAERQAYLRYGQEHGWRCIENEHVPGATESLAAEILRGAI